MKRGTLIKMMAAIIGASIVGSVTGVIAWFHPIATISTDNTPIDGATEGAYFAYGDGTTKAKAYGISKPRHLYNLAWLTYLGYFKDKQCYFELANDIDMTGWTLPPIGTSEYPFVGTFDGNDHVVSNFEISNQYSDYGTKHPGAVTSSNFKPEVIKIVGFFGVVGDIPGNSNTVTYSSQVNEVKNVGLADFTVTTYATDTLVGMAAGYVDATMSNVAVDVATIDVKQSSVSAFNANYTSRISDYGIIGYSTKTKSISKFSDTVYGVNVSKPEQFSVDDQGLAAAGWGGSLDMQKIYNNLKTVWNSAQGAGRVISREETHDAGGHLLTREETVDSTQVSFPYAEYEDRFTTTGSGTHYYANKELTTTNSETSAQEVTSSFGFVKSAGDSGTFIDITGDRDILMNPASRQTTDILTDISDGYLIKLVLDGAPHYLSLNGTTVADETDTTHATLWLFDSSAGTIRSVVDDEYYLTCDAAGNLSGVADSPVETCVWSYQTDIGYCATVNGTAHALGFDGSEWVTTTYTISGCYIIYPEKSAYLTHSLGKVLEPTDPSTNPNIRWYKNSDGYFGTTESATRFLGATVTSKSSGFLNNTTTYTYTLSANAPTYRFTHDSTNNTLTFHAVRKTTAWGIDVTEDDYYLLYDTSNNFVCSVSTSQALIVKDAVAYQNDVHCSLVTTEHVTEGQHAIRKSAFVHSYPTFWPLTNVGDTTSNDSSDDVFGTPDPINTGYIVGGANYTGDPMGDIRFAQFPDQHTYRREGLFEYDITVSSLRNSYTAGSNSFDHVYTIDSRGRRDILADYPDQRLRKLKYPKFDKAANRVIKNLKSTYNGDGTGSIPGLHFMDARITYGVQDGVDRSAYVERAVINEQSFSHYELPTTCIDFHLKDAGRITFFAGTYFWGNTTGNKNNNSFFSLHHVERYSEEEASGNPNQYVRANGIKSIKELSIVYQRTDVEEEEFAYKYTDGTFSSNYSDGASYDVIFDTLWIKQHQTCQEQSGSQNYLYDAAYYFEIPVNAGEYALGSVANGDGGYLMYLDIGANAAVMNRSIFGGESVLIQDDYKYPLGVAFVTKTGMASAIGAATVNPANSEFFAIYAGTGGDVTLTQTSSSAAHLTVDSAGLSIKAMYIYDQMTLHDPGGTEMSATPLLRTTKTIQQTVYMDFNEAMEETYQTGIIVTTTTTQTDFQDTPQSGGTVRSYWQYMPGSETKITDPDDMVFFETETGESIGVANAPILASTGTEVIEFTFETQDGVAATVTMTPKTTLNSDLYYDFTGYDVAVVDASNNPLEVTGVNVTIGESGGIQTVTITVGGITYLFRFNP